jgi:hypothetical protein
MGWNYSWVGHLYQCASSPRRPIILVVNGDCKITMAYPLTSVETERQVAERSILIKNMLEDLGDSGEAIPIPNVTIPPRSTLLHSSLSSAKVWNSQFSIADKAIVGE